MASETREALQERWCGGAVMGALVTGNAFSEHLIASLQCRQKEDV